MSAPRLRSITLRDFRSIRGTIHAPLDANVVLVHGENGSGKTSFLSAIELALTGGVMALERADPTYAQELTNKAADDAEVTLQVSGLNGDTFGGVITKAGQSTLTTLPTRLSSFFSERCYLPQSLLGQLLQIYQESNTSADSPLARFVTELLGLDRLDAIETGLQAVHDLRNFRKTTDRYAEAEAEQNRVGREIAAATAAMQRLTQKTTAALTELSELLDALRGPAPTLGTLEAVRSAVAVTDEEMILQDIQNQRRALRSIAAEGTSGAGAGEQDEQALADAHRTAEQALEAWQADLGAGIAALRPRVAGLDVLAGLEIADPEEFVLAATPFLASLRETLSGRIATVKADEARRIEVQDKLARLEEQIVGIDREIAHVADSPTALGTVLAEITSHLNGEVCPVCDRDFSETESGSLADHVSQKVRTLSTAAARLLDLTRSRTARQSEARSLETELSGLDARRLSPEDVGALERRFGDVTSLEQQVVPLLEGARVGSLAMRREAEARRALTTFQHAGRVQIAVKDNLVTFAQAAGLEGPGPLETASDAVVRFEATLATRAGAVDGRLRKKRQAAELISSLETDRESIETFTTTSANLGAERKQLVDALKRAAKVRRDGQAIEGTVKDLRSKIIRREFNDRLNTLWRDLFVRLAPNEPFVPAFKVPEQTTLRMQPKLITEQRDGSGGGAPGAMLSAGNLNTAALTLFISLHLTMKPRLPWLILDDPVQSMDDVHIAHFAALLRTLSRQHARQILVAVHDRQLFEYLKLELSPASPAETLLAIELVKTRGKDTQPLIDRRIFREEKALRFAA